MGNPFVHIELSTDKVDVARKFYKKLFDWKLQDMPAMGYTMIDVGKRGAGGGMQTKQMPDVPNAWLPYVEVESIKRTLAKAEKGGGRVILPLTAVGDMGAIGIIADPTGAAVGIWEATKKAAKKATKKATKKASKKKASKKA